ncbi:MAG: hypothetical protein ACOC8F_03755 [Planctomycetota bacterium]
MPQITVSCDYCGRTLTVDAKFAGKTGRCHYCSASVHIPAGVVAGADTAAGESAAPASPAAKAPEPVAPESPSARAGMVACGALLLATAFIPWGAGAEGVRMSWDVLRGEPGMRLLLIGGWALGAAALAGVVLGGMAQAMLRGGLAAGAMFLLAAEAVQLADFQDVLTRWGEMDAVRWGAAVIASVLAPMIAVGIRAQTRGGGVVRLVQAAAGLALAALVLLPLVNVAALLGARLGEFLEHWEDPRLYDLACAAVLLAALLWGGLVTATAAALTRRGAELSAAGVNAMRVTMVLAAAYAVARLTLTAGHGAGLRPFNVLLMLAALAALLCAGAVDWLVRAGVAWRRLRAGAC